MRDLFRDKLRYSLRALTPVDRLASAWPIACGRAMADHGDVVALHDGVLELQVTDSIWLTQMLTMRSTLQNDLARISGIPLTGIHFYLKQDRPKGRVAGDDSYHE